ncbi:MAG: aminotransferase class I/II-fold pyridoxal phosphate-dependent enzyme [Planctomycetaceae bacterium]|nr:MAG: aminotransferase class I/II-fold pyridoxal phosphate-dependent enzyme [Planctomycetaceae bacterium]
MFDRWLADRNDCFESSGIRKVFDLAAAMKDPINLSIGQPHFDVPLEIQDACIEAIRGGKNAYSQTQGIGPLRQRLADQIRDRFPHQQRDVLITSGTSGGLVLSMLALVNPGDEVIFFDPYFVMYPALVRLAGGVPVVIDTYPDFRINLQRVADTITSRTKLVLVNSPANPTGVTASEQELRELAELCRERGVVLVSDEIYSHFQYDDPFVSPASFNDETVVIDGFSKSHAMTGWRVGYIHGPPPLIAAMAKMQQFTFVCAPQPAQWGALAAVDIDLQRHVDDYRRKRDLVVAGLRDHYELSRPTGAFYAFPQVPWGTADSFVRRAIENRLLIIPGNIFSGRDSHFRISYAADDETLHRGLEVLRRLAH